MFSSYESYDEKDIGNYNISYGMSYSGYEDVSRYHVNVINFDDFDYIDEEAEEMVYETKAEAYEAYLKTCARYEALAS